MGRKIRITESQLKYIIERLGVPDNIIEVSNEIADKIISKLYETPNERIYSNNILIIEGDFNISDFKFKTLKIEINVKELPDYNDIDFISIASYNKTVPHDNFMVKNCEYSEDNNSIIFNIEADVDYRITNTNIGKLFKNKRNFIVQILTHELKHTFDRINNPAIKNAEYNSYLNNIGKSLKPLNDFIKALYYTHDLEKLVRNSEFNSLLHSYNIKRSEFNDFLLNSSIYKELNYYRNLTVDNIISELKMNYINDITLKIKSLGVYNVENLTDDEKIYQIFWVLYMGMNGTKLSSLKNLLSDPTNSLLSLSKANEKYYNEEFQKIKKSDVINYFRKKQTEININANETIKKLSKLYDTLTEGWKKKNYTGDNFFN